MLTGMYVGMRTVYPLGMTGRRIEFTSDPRVLAAQLQADFQELAEAARQVGRRGHEQLDHELAGLYHATSNMASRTALARAALGDSQQYREPPEWEVTDTVLRETQERSGQ